MKIGFYSPYLPTAGGGERYILTLAAHWAKTHDVRVFWDDPSVLSMLSERLGIDVSNIKVTQNIFRIKSLFTKLRATSGFDIIFVLSDGSIPTSLARRNILHFQMPFPKLPLSPFKLARYGDIVCNSYFTLRHMDPRIGRRASVIYPPVPEISPGKGQEKERMILSVGRFTPVHTAKKQDLLIRAFAALVKEKNLSGWKLVLAGGLLEGDRPFFRTLEKSVGNLPVTLMPNAGHDELIRLYRKARVYWHAAGYGEDEPLYAEHFGISTVEAMSAGCIPVVYRGGGLSEIVTDGQNGFLWSGEEELIRRTKDIIAGEKEAAAVSRAAIRRAGDFRVEVFLKRFDALIERPGSP
ncbi:glycosyltransferase family 4 protein [Patescibacteria group bacterium]|nr:glycosyltransferase family 4 protein [Patescibacteria group bacterium]